LDVGLAAWECEDVDECERSRSRSKENEVWRDALRRASQNDTEVLREVADEDANYDDGCEDESRDIWGLKLGAVI
jgi:hypothetical protein